VTSVKLGFKVWEIYIYPDRSGQTSLSKVNVRDATQVRSFAITILAGPVAELSFQGKPVTKDNLADLEGASSDIAKVGAFAQQYELKGVLEETVAMVKANKDAIVAVAAKLLQDGYVEGDELGGMI
jgi:hypothetical protein